MLLWHMSLRENDKDNQIIKDTNSYMPDCKHTAWAVNLAYLSHSSKLYNHLLLIYHSPHNHATNSTTFGGYLHYGSARLWSYSSLLENLWMVFSILLHSYISFWSIHWMKQLWCISSYCSASSYEILDSSSVSKHIQLTANFDPLHMRIVPNTSQDWKELRHWSLIYLQEYMDNKPFSPKHLCTCTLL